MILVGYLSFSVMGCCRILSNFEFFEAIEKFRMERILEIDENFDDMGKIIFCECMCALIL